MSATMVPYIISFAHQDYKRPHVEQIFGQGTVDDYKNNILVMICETVRDWSCEEEWADEEVEEVEERVASIYTDYSMSANNAWEAKAFVNGEWIDVTPTNKELAQRMIQQIVSDRPYKYSVTFPNLDECDEAAFERVTEVLKTFPYDKTKFSIDIEFEDYININFDELDYVALSDIANQITKAFNLDKDSYIIIEDDYEIMNGKEVAKLADELRGPNDKEEEEDEEEDASEIGEDEEEDESSDEEEYEYSSSKPKHVVEPEGTLYALFSSSDYRKENSVNFVGVFTNKQVAIDRISQIETAKKMMDSSWQSYRTPRQFKFENTPIYINGRPVNKDNIYVCLPDTNKSWPLEDVVRYENPWRIETLIGDEEAAVPQFEKEFGIKFQKGITYCDMYEYHGKDFGITFSEDVCRATLYLRSFVINKEHVISMVERFFKCFKTVYDGTSSKKICKYWIKNINKEKFINFNSQFTNTTNGTIYVVQPTTPQ